MFTITAKIADIETTEGSYKNKLIAERHKRRLEKRYPGTKFGIERISKEETKLNTYYAVIRIHEKGRVFKGE